MSHPGYLQTLAQYNAIANQRLYEAVAGLNDADYRRARKGSFGSIHGLLNHMLLGDEIWMARFEGAGQTTPALNTILFEEFDQLRSARIEQDEKIKAFFEGAGDEFLNRTIAYRNNQGRDYVDHAMVAALHFFNHHTHHRAQVTVMLSQTDVKPPSLDLHRIINP